MNYWVQSHPVHPSPFEDVTPCLAIGHSNLLRSVSGVRAIYQVLPNDTIEPLYICCAGTLARLAGPVIGPTVCRLCVKLAEVTGKLGYQETGVFLL